MPNDFNLGLLPERKINWRTLASSYGLVILFILILINVGLIWPEKLQLMRQYHFTELIPMPSLQSKPAPIRAPKVRAKLLPPAPGFPTAKLTVPREIREAHAKAPEMAPPKIVVNSFAPAVLKEAGGARPALIVHTGEFGSSAVPTVNAPVQKVQTGGFGDPNGIPAQGKDGAKLMMAKTGSFDLPTGAGTGNGSGGANGIKGTIASAGFGTGLAQSAQGEGRSNGRGSAAVRASGFGAQTVAQPGMQQHKLDEGPPTTTVEITYKPTPVYTNEARQLRLEGDVALEIMFSANGQLHVNRVLRGMGHGLDEAAIDAANQMRFKPALRNGVAVDSTAIVHVVFQLAY
jgi:TonB family protein